MDMELFDYEKEHLEILRGSLAECTVLLKYNGAFPLEKPCSIAAYGSGVRHTVKGGTGSGEVNSRFYVTIEQGLKDAGFNITSDSWLDAYDSVRENAQIQFIKDLKARAKAEHTMAIFFGMGAVMLEPEYDIPLEYGSDAAIYVLSRNSGEGSDRKAEAGDFALTQTEIRDILALNSGYEKFMLVLNTGGPVDLTPVADVGNILVLSQLGQLTGTALADILLGRSNPSGRLATTWSAMKDYCPEIDLGAEDDTYYKEGIYVGYRYFDKTGRKAAYPFGYGLSYTSFELGKAEIADCLGEPAKDDLITVTVPVTNTGSYAGREVVQIYVSAPEGRLDKPYQDLAAFAKTNELQPGMTQTVQASFRMSELASYDAQNEAYILEAGDYIVRVGTSSAQTTVSAVLELADNVIVKKVRSITGECGFDDEKYSRASENDSTEGIEAEQILSEVQHIQLPVDFFQTEEVSYDQPGEILPEVHEFTESDLIYMGIGSFSSGLGVANVIGDAGRSVAGAAGETTSQLKSRGIGTLVMADGPAGLRLSPVFYRDNKGVHSVGGGGLPGSMNSLLPGALKLFMQLFGKNSSSVPEGATAEYQYATAIPIGTAIAQSWNTDFARQCGDIVGDEMERMGVHLWLAPAMNIHRSVLCGRNFEYYSEDPLISGLISAGITCGVQQHPGRGVTIKHFAANNQETNRSFNNSHISERALREIYLKGFAICVRNAQPCAVMTSYNLLNGVHTSESRSLAMDYLRAENGFAGIIMTDWVVAAMSVGQKHKYRNALAQYVAAAGGDLFMPGSQADHNNVSKALSEGSLSRKQLEINTSRVLSMIRKLNVKG